MKIEQNKEMFCPVINKKTFLTIKVHLAERMCGYDLVQLSRCRDQENCGTKKCGLINQEEEKAVDQLIGDYYDQLKLRDEIRERTKDSNQ